MELRDWLELARRFSLRREEGQTMTEYGICSLSSPWS